MAVVPEFLLRRVYKKGSLKKLEDGVSFELKNILGPGFISGFNSIQINDYKFEAKDVTFTTQGMEIQGLDVSEENPVKFRLGQEGILKVNDPMCVTEGLNKIVIEIMNPEAGKIKLHLEDKI